MMPLKQQIYWYLNHCYESDLSKFVLFIPNSIFFKYKNRKCIKPLKLFEFVLRKYNFTQKQKYTVMKYSKYFKKYSNNKLSI